MARLDTSRSGPTRHVAHKANLPARLDSPRSCAGPGPPSRPAAPQGRRAHPCLLRPGAGTGSRVISRACVCVFWVVGWVAWMDRWVCVGTCVRACLCVCMRMCAAGKKPWPGAEGLAAPARGRCVRACVPRACSAPAPPARARQLVPAALPRGRAHAHNSFIECAIGMSLTASQARAHVHPSPPPPPLAA